MLRSPKIAPSRTAGSTNFVDAYRLRTAEALRENKISAVRLLVLLAIFFALLYLRRPQQLLHPQVWDEDGTRIIPALLTHGLASLFYPVNGYLIVLPKLISALALAISGLYYPLISTVIAWIFIVGVCLAVAVSPTWLRGGALLGMATLFVPTDPEVFGIPLYTFWWASLLLFLVVLWDENSKNLAWRVTFVVIGGLSSPIIFLVTPLLAIRAALFRDKRREWLVLLTAVICCCVQAVAMLHFSDRLTGGTINAHNLGHLMPKFLGGYLAGNFIRRTDHLVWIATGVFLLFLLATISFLRKRPRYLFLLGLWLGAIYFIGRRVDVGLLQTRWGAPRYFFLPFVLIAWYVVSVLAESGNWNLRLFAAALLFTSFLNMLPVRTRPQQDFHWAEQLSACKDPGPNLIAISYDGHRPWFLELSGPQCKALRNAGFLHPRSNTH